MNKFKGLTVVGLVLVALGAYVFFAHDVKPVDENGRRNRLSRSSIGVRQSAEVAVRNAIEGKIGKSSKNKRKLKHGAIEMFNDMKPESRKCASAIQDALDENDFKGVAAWATKAMRSSDPELRQHAVDALGWFGPEALPELTGFLSDPNHDVADAAAEQWQIGLTMIDDDAVRVSTAEAALKTLSNVDVLAQLVCEISAQDDDLKIMQSLVDIIDSGNPAGVKLAKEEYESLTGEEWSGIDAAERWLDENYVSETNAGGADGGESVE